MSTVQVFTPATLAPLLECSIKTVRAKAISGELPGIKFGDDWIFPAGAVAQRLDEIALQQAADRRRPLSPTATTATVRAGEPVAAGSRRGSKRTLPQLVDLSAPAA